MMDRMKTLFVHHSIGRHCLKSGLRRCLRATVPDVQLWDLDYNRIGLHGPDGTPCSIEGLRVPDDNTDPDGLAAFVEPFLAGTAGGQPAFGFDLLILKSCYTGARIGSDGQLDRYLQTTERTIDRLDRAGMPTVLLTPVPDSPLRSSRATAHRAATYASRAALCETARVRVVNLHQHLADPHGRLRPEYRRLGGLDPHPNSAGQAAISQLIADQVASLLAQIGPLPNTR